MAIGHSSTTRPNGVGSWTFCNHHRLMMKSKISAFRGCGAGVSPKVWTALRVNVYKAVRSSVCLS